MMSYKHICGVIWLGFAMGILVESKFSKREIPPYFHTAVICATVWLASF